MARRRVWGHPQRQSTVYSLQSLLATVYSSYSLSATVYSPYSLSANSLQSLQVCQLQYTAPTVCQLQSVYSPYSLSATVYSLQSTVYSLQSTVKTVNWGVPARAPGRPRPAAHPHSGPLKTAKFQFFELLAASGSFWERLESILSAQKPIPG